MSILNNSIFLKGLGEQPCKTILDKAIKRVGAYGGNAVNLSDYGLVQLADHLDGYWTSKKSQAPFDEDGFYEDKTITAFIDLVDNIAEDEIKNNQSDRYL